MFTTTIGKLQRPESRRHAVGFFLGSLLCVAPALQAADPGQFVAVRSVAAVRQGQWAKVTLQVQNTAAKEITAYGLIATVTYSNGQVRSSEITRDILPNVINKKLGVGPIAGQSFDPGDTTESSIFVPWVEAANDTVKIAMSTGTVTLAAFADKTAIGSEAAIARLAGGRRNDAKEATDLVADIKAVFGTADPRASLNALESQLATRKVVDEVERSALGRRISALKLYGGALMETPGAFADMVKLWQARADAFTEHSSLTSSN